jgi:hypothetical protein
MMNEDLKALIEGAQQLEEWFGYWPGFHDAEVLSLDIRSNQPSLLRLYFWHTDWNEVDEQGYFRRSKFVTVNFVFEDVASCELVGFNHGEGVTFGLEIRHQEDLFRVELYPCVGVAGNVTARRLRIELTPGEIQR